MATSPFIGGCSDEWTCFREDYRDNTVLPSFPAIRAKTLQTLYHNQDDDGKKKSNTTTNDHPHLRLDKSRKGSVDVAIRPLVDLINHHASFATLSSCSGRISLFDPSMKQQQQKQQQQPGSSPSQSDSMTGIYANNSDIDVENMGKLKPDWDNERVDGSGKGALGGWLFVSHEEIDVEALLEALNRPEPTEGYDSSSGTEQCQQQQSNQLSLRFEPMLLHVAACNLERGQQLLQLALQLGFRESGLVVTQSRVTVAIRSYSLALTIPFALLGPLQLPTDYLHAFVQEANSRLVSNLQRIRQLHNAFQNQFLERKRIYIRAQAQGLPNLGLWGHASVLFENAMGQEIVVFGGYGTGPDLLNKGASRSNKIYKLVHDGTAWGDAWEELATTLAPDQGDDQVCCQLQVTRCSLGVREGLRAIGWGGENSPAAFIYGGRTNPANPLGDLLLYCRKSNSFFTPVDIRGNAPAPRWGHSWTRFVMVEKEFATGRAIALLAGGRNESTTFSDFHILSLEGTTESRHLLWTQVELETGVPRSRCHHTAMGTRDGKTIVVGGLPSCNHLLGVDGRYMDRDGEHQMVQLSLNHNQPQQHWNLSSELLVAMFGQASCVLPYKDGRDVFLTIGGLLVDGSDDNQEEPLIQCFTILEQDGQGSSSEATIEPVRSVDLNRGNVGFGSLVHHTCHAISTSTNRDEYQLVVIGGGVHGFAFGPQFADSFLLTIQIGDEDDNHEHAREGGGNRVHDCPNPNHAISNSTSNPIVQVPCVGPPNANLETDVLFVAKRDAKLVRTHLEKIGFLDRRYRMTSTTESSTDKEPVEGENKLRECIAIPITTQGTQACLQQEQQQQQESIGMEEESNYSYNRASKQSLSGGEWWHLVLAMGRRTMPLSTANFAAKRKK